MEINISNSVRNQIKNGTITKEELAKELIMNSAWDLAMELADRILAGAPSKKITLNFNEFFQHFNITGVDMQSIYDTYAERKSESEGIIKKRGRKPKAELISFTHPIDDIPSGNEIF